MGYSGFRVDGTGAQRCFLHGVLINPPTLGSVMDCGIEPVKPLYNIGI